MKEKITISRDLLESIIDGAVNQIITKSGVESGQLEPIVSQPKYRLFSCPFCGCEQTGSYLKHEIGCYIRSLGEKYTDISQIESWNKRSG